MAAADKAMKLLDELEAKHARQGEIIRELRAALEAEPTVGQRAKAALDYFAKAWAKKYRGQKYVSAGVKDIAVLKSLLGKMEAGEIAKRMARYLDDDDRFVVNAKHPLTLFSGRVNQYTEATMIDDVARPRDCQHEPPCSSDAEHTRRRSCEARA